MASNYVQFTPSTQTAFSFQAQLSAGQYNVTVLWSIFGQRYYVNVSDLSGNLIVFRPLSGTGPIVPAQFTWNNLVATAACASAHNVPVGSVANAVISDTNSGFDGSVQVLAIDPLTLTYTLNTNPEESSALSGNVNFELDLLWGYGVGSLIFHADSLQFEF